MIKNRIQVTPHAHMFLSNGQVTDTLTNYYVERAKGEAGLLELSQINITPPKGPVSYYLFYNWEYDSARRFPFVNDPTIVPGLRRFTDAIHHYESKIFMEVAAWKVMGDVSNVPFESGVLLPELSISDIRELQEGFAIAAKHVKDAGFDGIDLHGSHGALIENFYSPLFNRRTDQYGGSLENRLRFLSEIIDMVRDSAGDGMALGMRMCADEHFEGGVTPDYAVKMTGLLDSKLDFINVDSGSYTSYEALDQAALQTAPLYVDQGYGVYLSEAVKKVAKKSKIGTVGRLADPLLAESILEHEHADYIGMTRALIADPELPKKAREGRVEDIRPCIATLQDCWGRAALREWPLRCTVNPAVGREKERGGGTLTTASRKKKILIIGSGPAGLEAARIASERRHDVTIYEKDGEIGGQLNLAKELPGRSDIGALVKWYESQLRKSNVRIELRKEVPEDSEVVRFLVEDEKPDAVILATGSDPIRNGMQMVTFKEVPGSDGKNVHTIDSILRVNKPLDGKIIVADSTSHVHGPGIAEWLSRKGRAEVTLVTPFPYISPDLYYYNQLTKVTRRLHAANVRILSHSWLRRIEEDRVVAYHVPTGAEQEMKADHVVLNTGRKQRANLEKVFAGTVKELHLIGDCDLAGTTIHAAIEAGYELGSAI